MANFNLYAALVWLAVGSGLMTMAFLDPAEAAQLTSNWRVSPALLAFGMTAYNLVRWAIARRGRARRENAEEKSAS